MSKKYFVLLIMISISVFLSICNIYAEGDLDKNKPDKVDKAIDKGIKFLLSQQNKDGSIGGDRRGNNKTAMTALAIMAISTVGNLTIDDTKEGKGLRKALDFVLRGDRQGKDGYFGVDGSRMYGHGIITLMLSEILGMGMNEKQDKLIRERLDKAIKLILRAQKVRKGGNHYGGWRYKPNDNTSDISITVWQVMALRSAKNAGLDVPKESIDLAVKYLKRLYLPDNRKNAKLRYSRGRFWYELGKHPSYSTTSAGLLALQVCGEYESPEVKATSEWLFNHKINPNFRWFFYGTYYYVQGMYQRGGKYAKRARKRVESILLEMQKPNGSWRATDRQRPKYRDELRAGSVYSTSMAILALSVKYHYLPIYQR
jgi:hypothetical protein